MTGLDDALSRLLAERAENTCRKDFTPSEAVALGKALETLERPKAKDRQLSGGSDQLPEGSKGETREIVGKAVGMSGVTYQRAKAVVAAAESDPEKFGPIAAEMDRTGRVKSAYNKVREKQGGSWRALRELLIDSLLRRASQRLVRL